MRHADAACGMRQQMVTVGTHRSDSICADAIAFCMTNTDAANWIGTCSTKKRIRTRIGQGIPRNDVSTYMFSQVVQLAGGISGKVVAFYICHRWLKHVCFSETTNISSRSGRRRRTSPHPAVVHERDDSTHHTDSGLNDVVNPSSVRLVSLSVLQHLIRCPNYCYHLCCSKYERAIWATSTRW